MNDKFKGKYRSSSIRLQNYDYGQNGAYFITICTKNRKNYFGEIANGKMKLSQIGIVADILWNEIPHHAKNIKLGQFIVMPNHVHGILMLDGDIDSRRHKAILPRRDKACLVSTASIVSTKTQTETKTIGQQRFQNQGKNTISSIIGGYKSAVTKYLNRLHFEFAWQPKFYDHIIRDQKSYQTINQYIINNPLNWKKDKLYV